MVGRDETAVEICVLSVGGMLVSAGFLCDSASHDGDGASPGVAQATHSIQRHTTA
jgi:hypothetical protein